MRRSLAVFFAIAGASMAAAVGTMLIERAAVVRLVQVEKGAAVELVYATGYVDAEHPVSVSARIAAPVRTVLVREGERVRHGQSLLIQDDAEQLGLLAQAQAQARGATLTEQRIVALYDKGWATRAARDEAVANGQSARASVAAIRARLDQLTVHAGIAGFVLRRDVEPGDLATPGRGLFQLGDPAQARVTATVDERDIPRVRVGQKALMSTDAMPGRIVTGHVTEITPGGDPDQRAFRVRIGLDRGQILPIGLTLEVNIVTQRHDDALLVPSRSIVAGKVWRVEKGRARQTTVRVGIIGTEKTEIRSGLAAGEGIIVDPLEGLSDGDKVRLR